jgi:alkanesulfonate monooxygenase SsuD/methylene tetrahydromethanopterin reductase-like flavin-dependent oxidoreductase (luciferase family)
LRLDDASPKLISIQMTTVPADTRSAAPAADPVRVGLVLREGDLRRHGRRLASLTRAVADAGIDHVAVGDHVSFAGGGGADGLVQATALLASHPTLEVQTAVYLLALRHPATVARQLVTISDLAPGRLAFGVGVGGDDPRELRLCGVDPRTRGARTTEAIELLRRFLGGEEVTFTGRFFSADAGAIRPAPDPPIPILVGGRSDAALARTGRLGDGWIGVWVSPRRYAEARERIAQAAEEAGRGPVPWQHTLQLWAGFDASRERAVARLRPVMEQAYDLPFERFARYAPCGPPEDVAAALAPYAEAGCRRFNFVPEADGLDAAIAGVAGVKELLIRTAGRQPAARRRMMSTAEERADL